MPTYAYACECGHQEERFLRMSEYKPAQDCPKCQAPDGLRQVPVVSAAGFQLKGGGYYATDFKNT